MTTAAHALDRPKIAVSKQFRPEIEGVRVIAALLVAGYHTWSGRVSGGVDVFFVMSGFLITTTLLGQLNAYGQIRPFVFLGRLATRLLPAALTTLAGVLVASWLFLPDLLWERIGHEVRASALYIENWYLAATSTDYLEQFNEKTPVQHFWALSLQGQFYIVWVLLFVAIAALIKRWPHRALGLVVGGLGSVFIASLAFSIWFTEVNQPVAYFATPARGWEFALGGLAAIALRQPPRGRSLLRWTLGWVGLTALLTTGLVFQVSTVFPGYAALLPTGAALMILFSAHSGIALGADRVLSLRPLVWLGGISYGIYLWHFPLLIFYRNLRDTEANSIRSGVVIILAAILLAWLTQRCVERPLLNFARKSREAKHIAVIGLLGGVIAVAVAGTLFVPSQSNPETIAEFEELTTTLSETAYDLGPCTGAAAGLPTAPDSCKDSNISALLPPPTLVKKTQKALACDVVHEDGPLTVCAGGSTSANPRATALMFGDSHSVTMRPALDLVAKHNNWRLLFTYSPGCQTAARPKVGDTTERCQEWLDKLTEYVRDQDGDIDALFNTQAAGKELVDSPGGDQTDASAASYRKQWDQYDGAISELVVIRDVPRMLQSTMTCIARHTAAESRQVCSRERSESLRTDYAALAAAEDDDPSTNTVDLSNVFCDERRCYPIVGDFIAYADSAHLSTVFVPTLTALLDARISKAVSPTTRAKLFAPALLKIADRS